MSRIPTYLPNHKVIPDNQVEKIVSEMTEDNQRYVDILTERVLENMRRRGAQNFGYMQARALVLRLIVKTEGNILL